MKLIMVFMFLSLFRSEAYAQVNITDFSWNSSDASSVTITLITPGGDRDGYLIVMNTENSFINRSGMSLPTANSVYSGSGEQVVGAVNSVVPNHTITGLNAGANYYVSVVAYKTLFGQTLPTFGGNHVKSVVTCGFTPDAITDIGLTATTNKITIDSFTRGQEFVGQIVKINTTNSFTPPASFEATLPTANPVYSGSGEQIVYAGSSATPNVEITNLGGSSPTPYYIRTYTFTNICTGGYYYETSGYTVVDYTCGNSAPPDGYNNYLATAGGSIGTYQLAPLYSRDNTIPDTGLLIYVNTENSFTDPAATMTGLPTVNSAYSGSGQQLISTTTHPNNFAPITGLTPNTTYYVRSYPYYSCGGNTYVNPADFRANSYSTCNFSDNLASAPVFGVTSSTNMELNSFSPLVPEAPATAPDGYVIRINDTNSFSTYAQGTIVPTGDPVYAGSGEQVIYAGNSTTPNLNVTGLSANTTYYFNIVAHYPTCGVPSGILYQQEGYTFSKSNGTATATGISFSDFTKTVGDADFNLTGVASDGSTVTYQIISQTGLSTSLSGTNNATVTLGTAGTVIIEATANGATSQATLTINPAPASGFTFTDSYIDNSSNMGTLDLSTYVSGAQGAMTYEIIGTDFGYSISGSNLNVPFTSAEIAIRATDAGSGETREAIFYIAAGGAKANDIVILESNYEESLSLSSTHQITPPKIFDDPTFGTFSGFSYTILGGPIGTYLNSSSQIVTSGTPGTLTLRMTATETFDLYVNNTSTLDRTYYIKGSQVLTFNGAANGISKTYGDADFALVASVTSGEAITFASSDPSVISISGSTATVHAPGYVEITASHAGNNVYFPAEASLFFTVNKAATSIVAITTQEYPFSGGAVPFIATAIGISSESLPLDISYRASGASDPFTATIPSTVGVYDTEVRLGAGALINYLDPGITTGTIEILDRTLITASDMTFNPPASGLTYDATEKTYTVTPTSLSPSLPQGDLDLTYVGRNGTTYTSSATAPTETGDYTVTAAVVVSNPDYSGSVNVDFTIAPAATSIVLNLPASPLDYNAAPQGISPEANDIEGNPTLTLLTEYSVSGANTYSTTAPTGAGTYDVRVNLAASETNYAATEATGSYAINPIPQVITFNAIPEIACGQTTIDLSLYASVDSGEPITFTSSDLSVATISGNTLTIVGTGTSLITAAQSGNGNLGAAPSQDQTLTVAAVQTNFTVDAPADVLICDGSAYVLPVLTSGDYFSGPGGTGTAYSSGESISSTITLYVYGASPANATCTDENSFEISINNLPIDDLADVDELGKYTLPVLTNGTYYTGSGGTGAMLTAGTDITASQTIYIYNTDAGSGCTRETSFAVSITPAPALHFEQVTNFVDYDYLSVPDDNTLDFTDHFTYEAWVNFDQLSVSAAGFGWRSLFQKSRFTDSYGLMVYGPSKLMRFYHAGVGAGFTDYTWSSLTAGAWHHVAVKWDGTNSKTSILIDGVEVSSNTSVTGTLPVNTMPLLIGAGDNRSNDPYPFDGAMDEIRFWNIARTDAEINANKQIELQGDETGLVLYYTFNEGTSAGDNSGITEVPDQTANGNNGSFNTFALSGATSNYVDGSGNGVRDGIPQSITFSPLSNLTFGDADFNLTATASSGLGVTYSSSNTAVATVSGSTVTIVGAGTTTITAAQVGNGTYLPASSVDQTLTVDPYATSISLNLPGSNLTYTGLVQGISPTANDINSSPTLTLTTEYSVAGANVFSTTVPVNGGSYDVRANLAASETNYTAMQVTGTYTIDKVPLTVKLDDASIVYGMSGANNHPATYTGFVNGETESVLTITTGSPTVLFLDMANASSFYSVGGPYAGGITWLPDANLDITSNNYEITFESGDITAVTPRPIEIEGNYREIMYAEDPNAGNTVTFQATYAAGNSGLASGETSADFTGTVTFANISHTDIGNYVDAILPTGGLTNANYSITYLGNELDIIERNLTVVADNRTIYYGDNPNVGNTVTYIGFAPGEDESVLGGTLTFQSTSVSGIGTYTDEIIPYGLTNNNYNIEYAFGNLTIAPKPLTITAENNTVIYGEDANLGNTVTYAGFISGEDETDLGGTLSFANIVPSNAGTYIDAIVPSGLTSSNYEISFVDGDLIVTPRPINITANNRSITYGADANTGNTITFEANDNPGMRGLASGESAVDFIGTVTFDNITLTDVATHTGAIIPNGGLTNSNYAFTYVPGNLTIDQATLTVKAQNITREYAASNPVVSVFEYSGFVVAGDGTDGDTDISSLAGLSGTGSGTIAVSATATANAGTTHGITVDVSGLSSTNYTFVADNTGILTIEKANAIVNLTSLTQTYDGTQREATATTTPSGLTVDFTYDGSATAPTNAGTYAVVGTINEANYIGTSSGTLTVDKGTAVVNLANLTQTYDGTSRVATATTTPSGLTVDITYDGSSTAPTNAGTYAVVGTINEANYTGTSSGTLTVDKATAVVNLANLTQTYDGTSRVATATTTPSGLTVDITYDGSSTAPTNAGTYAVVVTINEANYTGTSSGTLTVDKASAVVNLSNLTQTYNGTQRVATATTTPSGLTVDFTYDGSSTAPTNAGTYAVVGTINEANYTGTSSGTLTVDKASAVVDLANLFQTYDGTPRLVTATTTPSGLTVDFTYDGSSTAPTNAGNYLVVGAINDPNYTGLKINTFLVIKATATVNLASLSQTYDGTPRIATATTTPSGLTVDFTYDGSTTPPTNVGSYAVVGSINETNYNGTSSETLTVNKANQTITFDALADQVFGGADLTLGATASSGLSVTYATSDETVATVSGNTVTMVGVGTTNITASQAGDASYEAAPNVVQALTVNHGTYERYFVKVHSIYGMTAANQPILVKTLSSAEGQNIEALAKVGNQIWGTANQGGANSTGTLFRMDPDGTNFEVLHDFTVAEGSPRNDMAVVNDATVYGVAGDYGVFSMSVASPGAGPTFYNGYTGTNKFTIGLAYRRDQLLTVDDNLTLVAISTDFSGHESRANIQGSAAEVSPVTDFVVEGYQLSANPSTTNGVATAYWPHTIFDVKDFQTWQWAVMNDGLPNFIPVPVEDINQTKMLYDGKQYYTVANTLGNQVTFGLQIMVVREFQATTSVTGVFRGTIPAFSTDIDSNPLASLSKPYMNIYDVQDSVVWGLRGDATTGLFEAFSYDLKTTQYVAHDFGGGNLTPGVPNAAFFSFRKVATLVTQDQTKVYGAANPTYTYDIWGLDAGDDASTIGGVATTARGIFGTSKQSANVVSTSSHPGQYTIMATADTLNGKYDLRHNYGKLTITYDIQPSDITFSPATANYSYDGTAKSFTAVGEAGTPAGSSGLFADFSGSSLIATDFDYTYAASNDGGTTYAIDLGTTAPSNVGTYRVTATVKSANAVYSGSATFDFEITPIVVSVTGVEANNKAYDATTSATLDISGATLVGVVSGDVANVNLATATGTFAQSGVGTGIAVTTGLTLSGSAAGNYSLTQPSGLTAEITQKAITITGVVANNKAYDATTSATLDISGATLVGVESGDVANVNLATSTGTFAQSGVGTGIAVTTGLTLSGSAAGNYSLTQPSGLTAEITQKAVTVTGVVANNKAYDATTSATLDISGATLVGVETGDVANVNLATSTGTFAQSGVGTGIAVTTGLTLSGSAAGNYSLTQPIGLTADISGRMLSITADDHTKIVGAADPMLTYTITTGSLVSGDLLSGTLTRVAGETVGDYAIQQGTLDAGGNYAISFTDGTLTITDKIPQVISFDAISPATYGGGNIVLSATGGASGNPVTFTSSNIFVASVSGNTVSFSSTGMVTITASQSGDATYAAAASVTQVLTINPRPITITADAGQTKVYGQADPTLTYQITSGSLLAIDILTGDLSRVAGNDAGTYAIEQGTLANSNYDITFVSNDFSITPRAVTVAVDAGQTKVYGQADSANFTYTPTPALETGDSFTGALTREAGEGAGTYAISQGTLDNSNYSITFIGDDFAITPRAISVTVDAGQTKVYGQSDPANFSFTPTPALEIGDSFTGALTRETGESANTYAIQQGTLMAGSNYSITFNGDDFAITPRAVTVTVDAGQSKVYGQADPASFTYTPSPALETGDSFLGALTRVEGENAGTYAISQGTITAGNNYAISFNGDDFTIDPIALSVKADDKTKIQGTPNPAFTYTITSGSLINGDQITGALTVPASAISLGVYPIQQGTLSARSNYNISFTGGDFTITDKLLQSITFNALSDVTYGDADFSLSATGGGSANPVTFTGDDPTVATIASNGDVIIVGVGTVNITANQAGNATYAAADPVVQTLTVTPAALTITADNQSATYGDASLPALSVSYSGFVNSETESVLTAAPVLSTTAVVGSNAGAYPITVSGATAANYTITHVDGTMTIDPAALTITADNQSTIYGDAIPTLTLAYAGFVNSEDEMVLSTLSSLGTVATSTSSAGTYAITASGATAANYTITEVDGTLTIGQATLSVTANDQSKTYGDANPSLTLTYAGFVGSNDETVLDTAPTASTTATSTSSVGTYAITAAGGSDANYSFSYTDGTLTINQATLSVTADDQSKTYGDANPSLTLTYAGFVGSDDETVLDTAPTASTTATSTSSVGTYAVTASGGSDANYSFSYTDGTLTINQAMLSVTADDQSKTYGDANPSLTLTYAGFVGSDDATGLDTAPTASTTATSTSAAGTYAITAAGGSDANYSFSYTEGTLTVNQATLSVTADDQSKTYGDANPTLTLTYAGFVNGEDATSLTTEPSVTTSATSTSSVGTYAITASGGSDANYSFSYTDGTLTVNQATLSVTADGQSKTYGDANPTLTLTYAGFVGTDDESVLDTAPTASTTATSTSSVGTYAITAAGGSDANYSFSYTEGTLTVNQATLSVTADDQSKTYGDANPGLTLTYAGFVNGEDATSLTTEPSVTTSATSTSSVGTYAITAAGGSDANYSFSYTDGTLTINQATLSVTADDQSKTYGDANPSLTLTYAGFVGSDDETVLDTAPTASTTTTSASGVGTYAITAAGGSDANYSFSYTDGTLTINQATLSVTADDQSKTYGAANPALTLTYSGFVSGDDETVLDNAPSASTTATQTSDAGAYSITASGGVATNYDFSYTDGTLTINKADQAITFDALTDRSVGEADFDLTATASSGLSVAYTISDETVATVSGATVTILATGTTTITASQAGGTNFNAATEVTQTLTVNASIQSQTITFEALSNQTYGASPFELAATASSGLAVSYASSDAAVATVTGNTVTIHGIGVTTITANQAGNDRFTAAPAVSQTLTVDQATLTISANDQTKVYGEANPTFTLNYTGFVNGEDVTVLATAPTVSSDADASSATGSYEILVAGGSAENYVVTTSGGTLTITKASLVVTADDQTMRTGEAVPNLTMSYNGFLNGDTEADLDILPSIATVVTSASASGLYDITLSGGEDNNYELVLVNGTLTVETVLGLVLEQTQIMIYPNPVADKLYIDFPKSLSGEEITVQLFDLEGRKLQSKAVEGYGVELDVRELPAGIMILQMSAGGEVIRKRVRKD